MRIAGENGLSEAGVSAKKSHASFDFQFSRMNDFVDQNYITSHHYVLSLVVMDRKKISFITILLVIGIGLFIGLWNLKSSGNTIPGSTFYFTLPGVPGEC
jgi:hypothetical protein